MCLLDLGFQALGAGSAGEAQLSRSTTMPVMRSARKGLIVGLGNPKMVIFFLAFFPQFINPDRRSEAVQILGLGSVFRVIGAVWDVASFSRPGPSVLC